MELRRRTAPPVHEWGCSIELRIVVGDPTIIGKAPETRSRERIHVRAVGERIGRLCQTTFQRQKRLKPHLPGRRIESSIPHERVPVVDSGYRSIWDGWRTSLYGVVLDKAGRVIDLTFGRGRVGVRSVIKVGVACDVGRTDERYTLISRGVGRTVFVDLEDRRFVEASEVCRAGTSDDRAIIRIRCLTSVCDDCSSKVSGLRLIRDVKDGGGELFVQNDIDNPDGPSDREDENGTDGCELEDRGSRTSNGMR